MGISILHVCVCMYVWVLACVHVACVHTGGCVCSSYK